MAVGCSKHGPAPTATGSSSDQATASVTAPPLHGPGQPGAPVNVVVADTGGIDATLRQLSLEFRKYVARTRSVPKDFEEFAAKSNVQAPPPPAGRKYAIDGQLVVLVKR